MNPRRRRGGAIVGPLFLVLTGSLPAQEPVLETKPRKPTEVEFEASISTLYSSNPFHYSDSDLDDFDDEDGDGERFDGLDSEFDFITTAGLGADWKIPIEKGRKLRFSLENEYHAYALNSIGDYYSIEGTTSYDFTRIDKGSLGVKYTPSRFKKNYKLPSGEFDAAKYDQVAVELEFEREFSKRLNAGLGYEYKDREYNSEFDSRDRDGHTVFVHSDIKLKKKLYLGLELGYSDVDTDTERKEGVRIDRSYNTWFISPSIDTKVGDWDLSFQLDYERREYTTDEREDEGRYDRDDDRYGARIKAQRKLSRDGLEMTLQVGWRTNDANPSDSSIPTDETGYDEAFAGIGFQYSF